MPAPPSFDNPVPHLPERGAGISAAELEVASLINDFAWELWSLGQDEQRLGRALKGPGIAMRADRLMDRIRPYLERVRS